MIHGGFYSDEIKYALSMFGVLNVAEIKAKLALRNIKADETQILEGLEILVKSKRVRRSDKPGYFVLVRIG